MKGEHTIPHVTRVPDGRSIDKMSPNELRAALRNALQDNADLRDHNRFSAQFIESIQSQRREDSLVMKTLDDRADKMRAAAECFHENATSRVYDDVTCYYCEDCLFGWSD